MFHLRTLSVSREAYAFPLINVAMDPFVLSLSHTHNKFLFAHSYILIIVYSLYT